ncbi:LamG-like jellyroll fold domain-containing protein [Portibacter lacus]|uniref:SbsA Ig-like domain-containing protein n=1 Tax=Portibacter lacus TaxID=1099794 RepID=A0AA37WGS6_9BACT|nr:LamG-like jellyroll fold domain-containing protein [Portibacter lacus]GLR18075.1 hypothetical protein GCM10007940_26900 [Portibacter lacus]
MKILNYCLALFALSAITLTSCKDDPDPILAPTIASIEAVGTSFADGSAVTKDLNGASSAADVALNSVITITLDKAVDGTTVNVSNVAISNADGDVASTVTSSGSAITITPSEEMVRGTSHTLTLSNIKSSDGGTMSTVSRTFVTEGRAPVIVPKADDQLAYYNFDGTTDDILGNYNPDNVVGIEMGTDRFGQGNSTASFDGDVSIIEIPDADQMMTYNDFTLSFWMKTNTEGHIDAGGNPASHFVMGLGAFFGFQFEIPADFGSCKLAMSYKLENDDVTGEDLWFNGSGEDKDNGGWQGWDFVANLGEGGVAEILKDKWVHVVCSYNSTTKQGRMYFNGQLMKSQDFNLWPDCDVAGACKQATTGVVYRGNESDVEPILALGFIKSIDSPMWASEPWGDYNTPTSNHFKGDLDDIRIFKAPFSAEDVETLYNSEK